MKCKKLITLMLSCLLIAESPFVSQAASFSSASISFEEEPNPELPQQHESDPETAAPQEAEPANEEAQESQQTESEDTEPAETGLTVRLNYSNLTLKHTETIQLTPSVSYLDGSSLSEVSSAKIIWSSKQPDIASVSEKGLVTAHQTGTTVITAALDLTTESGSFTGSASCIITVANSISLNTDRLTLYLGETEQILADTSPESSVTWVSSNPSIAAVDANGTVTALKKGTATITATANGFSESCKITVKKPSLTLKSKATVYLNNPITLKATALPAQSITWNSSNPKVAKVNAKGKITPKKAGKTNITASCNGIKKTCKVTVKAPSIQLDTPTVMIFEKEDGYSLSTKAKPSGNISYHSSDTKIATVDKNGLILGKKAGTATITASVPGAETSCEVTVLKNNYKLSRTSQTLMKGQSATLFLRNASNSDSVTYELSDDSIASLSSSGNSCKITARKAGTATLTAYYRISQGDQWLTSARTCTIHIIDSGVLQQQTAIAVKTTQKLELKNINRTDATITETTWTSSDPKIAAVNRENGQVTGKKAGSAKITAEVSYSDGTSKEYVTTVKVSNPQAKHSKTVISLGHSHKIAMTGLTSYSNVKWKIKKPSLASMNQDGIVSAGYTPGKTTITIQADGKTIKHILYVTNPSLKSNYVVLAPGSKKKIPLSGVCSNSKVSYKSKKTSVATVSSTGTITAHKPGTANIIIKADGNTFTYQVSVAPRQAINACKIGYNIMYSSSYSQARRMSKGYYDCSSLVFRSYGCNAKLLGGISSWAPTAASMAYHMEKTGKSIAHRGVDVSKLRPGDLIFYGSSSSNGRYKNIYHVSMYYGSGYRLEKPLRYYYPESNIVLIARPYK